MVAKFGWILQEIAFKVAVNDILQVLIVSKSSLRLRVSALKFTGDGDGSNTLAQFNAEAQRRGGAERILIQ